MVSKWWKKWSTLAGNRLEKIGEREGTRGNSVYLVAGVSGRRSSPELLGRWPEEVWPAGNYGSNGWEFEKLKKNNFFYNFITL